jgi:hypothetical protein
MLCYPSRPFRDSAPSAWPVLRASDWLYPDALKRSSVSCHREVFQTVRRSVITLTTEPGPAMSTSYNDVSTVDWYLGAVQRSMGSAMLMVDPTFSCQLSNTLMA